jgi:hypothetical protein
VQQLLNGQMEWIDRYDGFANSLLKNKDLITSVNRSFQVSPPLYAYQSISSATQSKSSFTLDLRYLGQSVATITAKKEQVTISTDSKFTDKGMYWNDRDFGCNIQLPKNTPWEGKLASEFRAYFTGNSPVRSTAGKKRNEEHRIESALLTEFSRNDSKIKQQTGIEPVALYNTAFRFAMATPIRASDTKDIQYGKNHAGGGIDILCRTGRDTNTCLTVIEVKDENKSNEPPQMALAEGIAYAVFIRELLRSKSGANWYKLFGINGELPPLGKLKIRAACAMPRTNNADKSFENLKLHIDEDILECHYIYFDIGEDGKIENLESSLNSND